MPQKFLFLATLLRNNGNPADSSLLNRFTEFHVPKNMDKQPKIMFLRQLEGKICEKVHFWATLLRKSSNPANRTVL